MAGIDMAKLLAQATRPALKRVEEVVLDPIRNVGLERNLAQNRALQSIAGTGREAREAGVADALRRSREEAVQALSTQPEFAAEQFGRNLDWGFISPDPQSGVITATMLRKLQSRPGDTAVLQQMRFAPGFRSNLNDELVSLIVTPMRAAGKRRPVYDEYESALEGMLATRADDLGELPKPTRKERANAAERAVIKTFLPMEYAGIPREWTGAISKALPEEMTPSNARYVSFVREVSSALRDMTNDQRNLFLSQLKNWRGPVDQLAEFVLGA